MELKKLLMSSSKEGPCGQPASSKTEGAGEKAAAVQQQQQQQQVPIASSLPTPPSESCSFPCSDADGRLTCLVHSSLLPRPWPMLCLQPGATLCSLALWAQGPQLANKLPIIWPGLVEGGGWWRVLLSWYILQSCSFVSLSKVASKSQLNISRGRIGVSGCEPLQCRQDSTG